MLEEFVCACVCVCGVCMCVCVWSFCVRIFVGVESVFNISACYGLGFKHKSNIRTLRFMI